MGLNDDAIAENRRVQEAKEQEQVRQKAILDQSVEYFKQRLLKNLQTNYPAAKGVSEFVTSGFKYENKTSEYWGATVELIGFCGDVRWENEGHEYCLWFSHENNAYADGPLKRIYIRIDGDYHDANTLAEIGHALEIERSGKPKN